MLGRVPGRWTLMTIIWAAGWACWAWARAGSGHTAHRAWPCIPPLWVVLQVLGGWQTALLSWEDRTPGGCEWRNTNKHSLGAWGTSKPRSGSRRLPQMPPAAPMVGLGPGPGRWADTQEAPTSPIPGIAHRAQPEVAEVTILVPPSTGPGWALGDSWRSEKGCASSLPWALVTVLGSGVQALGSN